MLDMTQSPRGHDLAAIARTVDREGFAVLPDYVPPDRVRHARAAIEAAVRANGNESVGKGANLGEFDATFIGDLTRDPDFFALCRGIHEAAHGRAAPDSRLVPSLRCLSGQSGARQSMIFHYDSYLLTAIIPIMMPHEGKAGRLIVYPNRRRVRATYLGNFLDKLVIDSKRWQRRYHAMYARGSDRFRFIEMQPGSLYLFWGYRSIHTNEVTEPDQIRSTAIYHYHDPHAGSAMKKVMQRRNPKAKAMSMAMT